MVQRAEKNARWYLYSSSHLDHHRQSSDLENARAEGIRFFLIIALCCSAGSHIGENGLEHDTEGAQVCQACSLLLTTSYLLETAIPALFRFVPNILTQFAENLGFGIARKKVTLVDLCSFLSTAQQQDIQRHPQTAKCKTQVWQSSLDRCQTRPTAQLSDGIACPALRGRSIVREVLASHPLTKCKGASDCQS